MATILVVDGDEHYRLACCRDLERDGHEVLTAATGVEALRVADEHVLDVAITEVQLPGMDGLDLMARLLERQHGIVVILNSKSCGYRDNFMSWAADACLTKPIDGRELSAKVRELLNRQQENLKKNPVTLRHKQVVPRVSELELVHRHG